MKMLRGWISARPFLAVIIAIVVGGVSGNSTGSGEVANLKERLTSAKAAAERAAVAKADLEDQLAVVEGDLEDANAENSDLSAELDETAAELRAIRARRPMPLLVGKFAPAAEDLTSSYDWQLQVTQQPSAAPVGKILGQSPAPGTVMRQGGIVKVTVAKPLPPGWKDIKVWSGSGSYNTGIVNIPHGKVRVVYDFAGDTNAVIVLMKKPNEWIDLLLNEIGDMSGTSRLYYTGPHWFEIEGGSWTVRLQEWR